MTDVEIDLADLPQEKECSHCGDVKVINSGRSFKDGFHKRHTSADGYRSQCKECYNGNRYENIRLRRESGPFRLRHEDDIGVSPDLVPDITLNSVIRDSKMCKSCKEWKPFEEFHKHKTARLGCHPVCKICRLEEAYQKRTGGDE